MKNNTIQVVIALVLVVLLLALADLIPFWMPDMAEMLVLLGASTLLLVWAGFVMYEKSGDERELTHRMNAGRVAYLSGIGTLTVALIVQGLAHAIDPWIAVTLGVMVVSKLGARIFADKYH
jgi:hypothetical protein